MAGERVLDTYRQEREPHVRAIIETAIAMGKVVCILDADAAAARNQDMLARKMAGGQDVSVKYPDYVMGCCIPRRLLVLFFRNRSARTGGAWMKSSTSIRC